MHKLRHKNTVVSGTAQAFFLQPQVGQKPWAQSDAQGAHAALLQAGMHSLHAHGLHLAMGQVFIGVDDIKTLPGDALGVPAEPELVDPARTQGQPWHLDVLEELGRLVKALRDDRDVAFVEHGGGQGNRQTFSATAYF